MNILCSYGIAITFCAPKDFDFFSIIPSATRSFIKPFNSKSIRPGN